ncbi:hypothetical protein F6B41_27580 [Microbacterium lushaniae]|nr:hypothetical protein F6B41_27580 [Microbacterium lushaniae]
MEAHEEPVEQVLDAVEREQPDEGVLAHREPLPQQLLADWVAPQVLRHREHREPWDRELLRLGPLRLRLEPDVQLPREQEPVLAERLPRLVRRERPAREELAAVHHVRLLVQDAPVPVACRQPAEVLQQAALVVLRPEPDPELAVAVHVPVDQWQLQPQLAARVLAHVDLPEREVLDAELADLRVRHFAAACQVVVPRERLLEELVQGVEPRAREVPREPPELQDAHWLQLVRELVLAELVEVAVDEPVWRDHVEVDPWVLLLACRAHQVRERLVQDRLGRDERELVQPVAEVACQRPWPLPRWCRRQQLVAQLPEDVVGEEQQLLLEPPWLQLVRCLRQQRQLVRRHVQQLQRPALRRWQVDVVARVEAALVALLQLVVAPARVRPDVLAQLLEVRELACLERDWEREPLDVHVQEAEPPVQLAEVRGELAEARVHPELHDWLGQDVEHLLQQEPELARLELARLQEGVRELEPLDEQPRERLDPVEEEPPQELEEEDQPEPRKAELPPLEEEVEPVRPALEPQRCQRLAEVELCLQQEDAAVQRHCAEEQLPLLVHPPLHLLEELQEAPVQVVHRVRAPLRELHGLHPVPTPLELHRVRERRLPPEPLEVRRRERVLRELRLREHERRAREGQRPPGLLDEGLLRQEEPELARHQLPEPEELERHPGCCLQQSASVRLRFD